MQNDQERTESCFVGDDYYLTGWTFAIIVILLWFLFYCMAGDRGYFDEDGYIWFVSRSDDVIITAG